MTVSRVINGRKGVGAETRAMVKEAILALGYTPNVAARSLVTSAELRIGVIYSNPSAAFMSDFLTGVFEEASMRGARLILLKGEAGRPPTPAALDSLIASGVCGMILAPPLGESQAILQVLRQARLPMAAVGAYAVDGAICVRIDDRRAAYEMTRELLALGHRQLGFILGNPDQAASERLLDATPRPTAIFASNDDMAAAAISVAHRRQIDVPRELTVVGFDDTTAAVTLWPPLTTVHQPVRRLASAALGLLAAEIAQPAAPSEPRTDHVLDHEITKRQSTSPLKDGEARA